MSSVTKLCPLCIMLRLKPLDTQETVCTLENELVLTHMPRRKAEKGLTKLKYVEKQ